MNTQRLEHTFTEIRSIARREQRPVHSVASDIVNDLRNIAC